ncbi:MAG: glycoside hydrolase family 127 protein [Ferruginibacter sp.]
MRLRIFLVIIISFVSGIIQAQQKDYSIQAIDFTRVQLTDHFWLPRIETNRTVTIPASFARCESTGRVKNFIMAAEHKGKFCTRYPFDDTDIYKTIEGASYSLATHPDKQLEAYVDSLITIISKAQEPDGYLYTARTIDPEHVGPWLGKERWEKERELSHELYNAGHLYEAAVAHYLATKKTNLLNIALKNADLVCSVFGPGKKMVAPGHEIVEMGLVKLFRVTGKKEYLNTAKFFIEARGHYPGYDKKSTDPWKNGSYWQDDKPVTEQDEAEGHAVRAGYLYSAVADIAALTNDDSLLKAIDRIWENVVQKKIYVQGGVGANGDGERYDGNYVLPNTTAYNETCAAIANVYWNQRMFLLHGDSKYIDVLEKTLYNSLISGIGLDGKSFFYTNAMQIKNDFSHVDMENSRSGWFECSCCPTNLTRLIPSVPGYVYAVKENNLYVNLFVNSTAHFNLGKTGLQISQQNNYPWDGKLVFAIDPQSPADFNVRIRIPGWARNEAIPSSLYFFADTAAEHIPVLLNGKNIDYKIEHGYAVIFNKWKKGDRIEMELPMKIQRVLAGKELKDDAGKVALQRGPLIYCAEAVDNNGQAANIILPSTVQLTASYQADLLNGVTLLKGTVPAIKISDDRNSISTAQELFTAIPYYAWANRGKGEMMIWMPQRVTSVDLISQ